MGTPNNDLFALFLSMYGYTESKGYEKEENQRKSDIQ